MVGQGAAARFVGKVAVVTGGASGIGLAVVRRLRAEGVSVVACDLDPHNRVPALEAEFGGDVAWLHADVTREADMAALTSAAVARYGGLDCAFNVAGGSRPSYLFDMAEDDWHFVLDLCLKGVMLGLKHQARQMAAQGRDGAIANVASLNAHVPMHAGAAYATAKAGVEMLTRNAALELAEHGVGVNAVLRGLVETPLTRRHFDNDAALAAFKARIPMGRPAQPDEVAGPVLFLASADAGYALGASLLVDGAWAVSGYPDMRSFRGPSRWNGAPRGAPALRGSRCAWIIVA